MNTARNINWHPPGINDLGKINAVAYHILCMGAEMQPLTASDVRQTLECLKNPNFPIWEQQLEVEKVARFFEQHVGIRMGLPKPKRPAARRKA
jgi:hypothetical protein